MQRAEESLLGQCHDLLNKIKEYPENKKCFDCVDTTSPRYVCTNFSTFVCSCCANVHKEFGHVIRCVNVFECTLNEILQLKLTGNKLAADKWLARWTPQECPEPDPTSLSYKSDARAYLRRKYIEKEWVKRVPPTPTLSSALSSAQKPISSSAPVTAAPSPAGVFEKVHDTNTRGVRAATFPTPPFVYHYVPHQGGMYAVPMSLPQDQYTYSRYPQPVPLDLNQVYYHPPLPPPSHSHTDNPFHEPNVMYGMMAVDGTTSPQRPILPVSHSHSHTSTNPFSPSRPEARILRSVTDSRLNLMRVEVNDNGSAAAERVDFVRSVSANCVLVQYTPEPVAPPKPVALPKQVELTEIDAATFTQTENVVEIEQEQLTEATTTTNNSNNPKWKVNSIMNKVSGLLKKTPPILAKVV